MNETNKKVGKQTEIKSVGKRREPEKRGRQKKSEWEEKNKLLERRKRREEGEKERKQRDFTPKRDTRKNPNDGYDQNESGELESVNESVASEQEREGVRMIKRVQAGREKKVAVMKQKGRRRLRERKAAATEDENV